MIAYCKCCKETYDTDECPDDHDPDGGVCWECICTGKILEPDDEENETAGGEDISTRISLLTHKQMLKDEEIAFQFARTAWLKENNGDETGAELCARGSLIVYRKFFDTADHKALAQEGFDESCKNAAADIGCEYVKHYRDCKSRGMSDEFATKFADAMFVTGDERKATDFASGL